MGLFDRAYPEAALREELARQQLEELQASRGLLGRQKRAAGLLQNFQEGGSMAAQPEGYEPASGITWEQPRVPDAGYLNYLNTEAMGGPLAAFQNRQAVAAKAAEPYTLNPGDQRMSGDKIIASAPFAPAKNETPTSVAEYQAAKDQGYNGTYAQWRVEMAQAGSTKVNLDMGQRVGAELEKNFAPLLKESYNEAIAAAETLNNTRQIKGIVDKGIITGTGADFRLGFAKALSTAGITDGEDVANTETFITQMGRNVLNLVKGLGAGTGISNADLKFAERVAAGDIALNEQTIRDVLDLQERASIAKVSSYNKRFKGFFDSKDYPDALKEPYRVQMPEAPAGGGKPSLQSVVDELRKRGVVQ